MADVIVLGAIDDLEDVVNDSVTTLNSKMDSVRSDVGGDVTAVKTALEAHDMHVGAAFRDIKALLGDVGAVLDKINGEVV